MISDEFPKQGKERHLSNDRIAGDLPKELLPNIYSPSVVPGSSPLSNNLKGLKDPDNKGQPLK